MMFRKNFVKTTGWMMIIFALMLLVVPVQAQYGAEVDYLHIDTTITDGYAITVVEEKLDNNNDFQITDDFRFLIPEKAFMSGFSIIIDGKVYDADILKKEDAQQKFEDAVASGNTAGLLETRGTELFSYSLNFEAKQSVIVRLTYEQALSRTLDEYEFVQPLRSNHFVDDLSVSVNISSSTDLLSVQTPDFRSSITYPDANSAHVSYMSSSLPVNDMKIVFRTENTALNGEMLFYEINGTGYFMHIFSPTANEIGTSPLDKDIIFVIDKSGSMSGLKMDQVRAAFSQIIEDLPEDDQFNIVFFDYDAEPYVDDILVANSSNKANAVELVLRKNANGGTNINEALVLSLEMFWNEGNNVPIIVFLTDGRPTVGVESTAVIRKNVKKANNVDASIFSIAFGEENDYDFEFLQALSLENGGQAVYFEANSEAAEGITGFYDTISKPLVSDLVFTYDEGTSDVVLIGKDHLFVGSESIIVGKYKPNADAISSRAVGNIRNGEYVFEDEFFVKTSGNNAFISRLWAYNTIMSKLDDMKVEGYNEDLVAEITNISLEYGFVTPYTAFFVEVPQAERPEATEGESTASEMPTEDTVSVVEEEEVAEEVTDEGWVDYDSITEGEATDEEMPVEDGMPTGESPGFSFIMCISIIGYSALVLRAKEQ